VQNIGCVTRGEGRSGKTGASVVALIQRVKPAMFFLENVKSLNAGGGKNGTTDLQFLTNEFKRLGYMIVADVLTALSYGCPQSRDRWYIIGVLISDIEIPMPEVVAELDEQGQEKKWRTRVTRTMRRAITRLLRSRISGNRRIP
jgi:site-specific DNA-cytosine methylase